MKEKYSIKIIAPLYLAFFVLITMLLIPIVGYYFAPLFGGLEVGADYNEKAGYIIAPVISIVATHILMTMFKGIRR